jgi:hypothetical protein
MTTTQLPLGHRPPLLDEKPELACLLAQMIAAPDAVDQAPLACVAKHLKPNGFTALVQNPDIPTYLVGSAEELQRFHTLVPAPNDAYTTLFWPYRTSEPDAYVQQRQKAERDARKAAKASGMSGGGSDSQSLLTLP